MDDLEKCTLALAKNHKTRYFLFNVAYNYMGDEGCK